MAEPCEVWFYHLERSPLEMVLPELLTKVLGRGWRALLRVTDAARAEALDAALWTFRDDAFIPHGLAGAPFAECQPVLLTHDAHNVNGADAVFLIDAVPASDLEGYLRALVLFEGQDPAALGRARQSWAAFKAAGHSVSYWRQGETRGWEKQA